MVSDVDEEALEAAAPEASPEQLALLLARAKAEKVAATVDGPAIVLGCDSVFELDGTAFGKPQSPDVARQRWRQMMGRAGTLHTGHHVIETSTGRSTSEVASTVVHMGTMSDEEMDDYLATGEPLHVAGGFTLDGLGGAFVEAVEGDPSNVVGISLPTVRRLLSELGVRWTSLWSEGLIDHSDPR